MATSRKQTTKRRITAPQPSAPAPTLTRPQWVSSMQEHFQRTGFYRAQDMYRLIGDPKEQVVVSMTTDLEMASRVLK